MAANAIESRISPMELGWFTLCVPVADVAASLAWYERLGFKLIGGQPEQGWVVIGNGNAELSLMQGLPGVWMNFRGADIAALAATFEQRGIVLDPPYNAYKIDAWPPELHTSSTGELLSSEGSGDFTIADPDGNVIYFDTVPIERARHAAGHRYTYDATDGGWQDGEVVLGRFTYCLNVADVAQSIEYYRRLGLVLHSDNSAAGWAVVGYPDRERFTLSLFQGHIDGNLLNFRGGDVFALARSFKRQGLASDRGPEVEEDGSSGLWLTDPDGHVLYFNTAPGEQITATEAADAG